MVRIRDRDRDRDRARVRARVKARVKTRVRVRVRARVRVGVISTGLESELRFLELDPGQKLRVEVKDRELGLT